jgi:hypothetical protein
MAADTAKLLISPKHTLEHWGRLCGGLAHIRAIHVEGEQGY